MKLEIRKPTGQARTFGRTQPAFEIAVEGEKNNVLATVWFNDSAWRTPDGHRAMAQAVMSALEPFINKPPQEGHSKLVEVLRATADLIEHNPAKMAEAMEMLDQFWGVETGRLESPIPQAEADEIVFLRQVCEMVNRRKDVHAEIMFPYCVEVRFKVEGRPETRYAVFGTANANWCGDFYASLEDFSAGRPMGHVDCGISSGSADDEAVGAAILRAIEEGRWK